ncbi:amidase [Patellaria atrata CBS 101060]|uniref:Amidase n=1 Tax=Patellaria atrata CBS 101060 TaxID=1346257 RepID=A0A9P4S193_9PEZI|nr:amidase [Patellaria atrata CBS 101060]
MHQFLRSVFRVIATTVIGSELVSCSLSYVSSGNVTFPKLIDVTVEDLAQGLESGLFSSVDLVNAYTARIRQVNSTLNVVTELNPDALSIAEVLDTERANGTLRGPLHGIPILIKNNIATSDKMNNTAGSWALVGAEVPRDSHMAAKLRESGMVILGKLGLSEWANFRSTNSSNGWSGYGGQVYAAYHPHQDPSGSSSGSGVASALGLALASLGTETSGSILSPSNRNNVVGIKPTVGLTSRSLVIPISEHQDTVGPMARTVKDAAYILHAIAGVDPRDNYTSAIPNNGTIPYYPSFCNFSALSGVRLGVPSNVIEIYMSSAANPSNPEVEAFYDSLEILKAAGATIVENANYTAFQEYRDSNSSNVIYADFINNLKQYLDQLTSNPNNITDLESLNEWTKGFPLEEYPDRNTDIWETSLSLGWNNTAPEFWEQYQQNLYFGGEGGVLGALDRDNLDAIILPTSYAAGVPALVGAPVITVPLGFYSFDAEVVMNRRGDLVATGPQVPFGISFLGRKWSEAQLIGFAYAFEQRTMTRNKVQPFVVPNVELMDIIAD